mgnify:CR=1 FL=1
MDFFIKNSKNTIIIESNFVEGIMVQNTQSMPDMAKDDEIDLLNAIRNSGMDVNSYLKSIQPKPQATK